jgi:hypothetical protein
VASPRYIRIDEAPVTPNETKSAMFAVLTPDIVKTDKKYPDNSLRLADVKGREIVK